MNILCYKLTVLVAIAFVCTRNSLIPKILVYDHIQYYIHTHDAPLCQGGIVRGRKTAVEGTEFARVCGQSPPHLPKVFAHLQSVKHEE